MHRHAVREQSKHRLAEHPIAHRAERNRRVFKRRIAQTHILFAHIRSPHSSQLPQHHRAPPVFLQFRHNDFDALDELRSKRLQSLTSPSETSSGSSRSTSTTLSLLDRQTQREGITRNDRSARRSPTGGFLRAITPKTRAETSSYAMSWTAKTHVLNRWKKMSAFRFEFHTFWQYASAMFLFPKRCAMISSAAKSSPSFDRMIYQQPRANQITAFSSKKEFSGNERSSSAASYEFDNSRNSSNSVLLRNRISFRW